MATSQLAPTLPSSLFISSPLPSSWQTETSLANLNLNNMLDKKAVGTPVATAPSSGFTPGFLRRHSASNLHALAHPAPSPGSCSPKFPGAANGSAAAGGSASYGTLKEPSGGGGTALLTGQSHLNGVDLLGTVSLADLDGYGQVYRLAHRQHDIVTKLRFTHQGAAAVVVGNFRGGASHIDIDKIGCDLLRCHFGGLRHNVRIIPEQLHRRGAGRIVQHQQFAAFAVTEGKALAADHLADTKRGALCHT